MRILFLLLIWISPLCLSSQINQTDQDGVRQGFWQKKFPDGQIMYEGGYRDGKPAGQWTRYHEGGQVKAKIRYAEDSDSALVTMFDPLGNKLSDGIYLNEKREGTWTFYSDGLIISEEEYRNGIKHGVSKKFYPTGELLEEAEWRNGQQEGNYQVFFEDGQPYMQCKFSNNRRNGLCLVRFKNNRIEMEAFYVDNLRHGEWKFYNEQGDYLYSLEYDHGKLLNPEVRDSIDNQSLQQLETGRRSISDPEKFINNPAGYLIQQRW